MLHQRVLLLTSLTLSTCTGDPSLQEAGILRKGVTSSKPILALSNLLLLTSSRGMPDTAAFVSGAELPQGLRQHRVAAKITMMMPVAQAVEAKDDDKEAGDWVGGVDKALWNKTRISDHWLEVRERRLAELREKGEIKYTLIEGLKAGMLLGKYSLKAINMRSDGFSNEAEHWNSPRMTVLNDDLKKAVGWYKLIGGAAQGTIKWDDDGIKGNYLEEDIERLRRMKLLCVITAGAGAATVFVSEWEDNHVCVELTVVNPDHISFGEAAEQHLLKLVTKRAIEEGKTDIRLRPTFQADGDKFYEACGFFPIQGDEDGLMRFKIEA